jgi:SAM-dependent methyltransferase
MTNDSIFEMASLLALQERERFLAGLLRRHSIRSLEGASVFEAGCGEGYNLRLFVQWGAQPPNVRGIDRDQAAVALCHARSPEIRVHHGSADEIPEPDTAFDISLAFSLFSRISDEDLAHHVAQELFRVTKPGGLIVVYDVRRVARRSWGVHAIGMDDVRRWFPKCPARARSITLAQPACRLAGRYAPWAYGPLAAIPALRSHAIYVLRRPATTVFLS